MSDKNTDADMFVFKIQQEGPIREAVKSIWERWKLGDWPARHMERYMLFEEIAIVMAEITKATND